MQDLAAFAWASSMDPFDIAAALAFDRAAIALAKSTK